MSETHYFPEIFMLKISLYVLPRFYLLLTRYAIHRERGWISAAKVVNRLVVRSTGLWQKCYYRSPQQVRRVSGVGDAGRRRRGGVVGGSTRGRDDGGGVSRSRDTPLHASHLDTKTPGPRLTCRHCYPSPPASSSGSIVQSAWRHDRQAADSPSVQL